MLALDIFAVEKLNIDPDTLNGMNMIVGFLYLVGVLGIFGYLAWTLIPIIYSKRKQNRKQKIEASTAIRYDTNDSELHYGHNRVRIEPKSFEHFICEIILATPDAYHDDLDIFEARDGAVSHARESQRGVEQAVRRLNNKARKLGLKNDLFQRSKERTVVNKEYRLNIINN